MTAGCGTSFGPGANVVEWPVSATDPGEAADADASWPQFRGLGGAGISRKGSVPLTWDTARGVAWKVAVAGEGNSSPVIWKDRVLLTSAVRAGSTAKLQVLCFDADTGQLDWTRTAATISGQTHPKNGYASATVATDGDRIFAFFGSAGLFCYDFAGSLLWHAELGALKHKWGTASSPVLWEDLVIQLCDRDEDSFLVALDQRTGRERWRTPRSSYGCWTTPILIEAARKDGSLRTELVINGTGTNDPAGGEVIAYDPATGRELWSVRGTTDIVCPIALAGGGLVYSTSGRNGPVLAIRPGGDGEVTDSHIVWKARRGGPYVPSGIFYRGRLYTVTDSGIAHCYDASSGDLLWRHRLGGDFSASLVAGDGRIYATDEAGTTYVFAAEDRFRLLAVNRLGSRTLATPAIAGGRILLRTVAHLVCIEASEQPAQLADVALPEATPAADSRAPQPSGSPSDVPVAPQKLQPDEPESAEAALGPQSLDRSASTGG